MLGGGMSAELGQNSPKWFWGDALTVLNDSDAVIANVQSPLTTSKLGAPREIS